jgi:hypothetical protein
MPTRIQADTVIDAVTLRLQFGPRLDEASLEGDPNHPPLPATENVALVLGGVQMMFALGFGATEAGIPMSTALLTLGSRNGYIGRRNQITTNKADSIGQFPDLYFFAARKMLPAEKWYESESLSISTRIPSLGVIKLRLGSPFVLLLEIPSEYLKASGAIVLAVMAIEHWFNAPGRIRLERAELAARETAYQAARLEVLHRVRDQLERGGVPEQQPSLEAYEREIEAMKSSTKRDIADLQRGLDDVLGKVLPPFALEDGRLSLDDDQDGADMAE